MLTPVGATVPTLVGAERTLDLRISQTMQRLALVKTGPTLPQQQTPSNGQAVNTTWLYMCSTLEILFQIHARQARYLPPGEIWGEESFGLPIRTFRWMISSGVFVGDEADSVGVQVLEDTARDNLELPLSHTP
jgi:hypothetical protein